MGEKEFLRMKGITEWLEGEEFLTIREVAGLLRIPPGTVYVVMKRERVQGHLIQRRRCYRRTDIEQLMERRRTEKELRR